MESSFVLFGNHMSKIGKQPIPVPSDVNVTINGRDLAFKGPKGELSYVLPDVLHIERVDANLQLSISDAEDPQASALFGMARSIIKNLVDGVANGFVKKLQIVGVGYKAQAQGKKLILHIGHSHPSECIAPEGIAFAVENDIITVSGSDKALVGQVAADIRALRKPEPYKGKGIRYVDEYVRRKSGKVAAGASDSAK